MTEKAQESGNIKHICLNSKFIFEILWHIILSLWHYTKCYGPPVSVPQDTQCSYILCKHKMCGLKLLSLILCINFEIMLIQKLISLIHIVFKKYV